MDILLAILLAFIAGILIGVVISRTEDSFIDSFRKWLDEETQGDEKRRTDIEYDIEKSQSNFRKWVKNQKEEKRRSRRKFFLYYLLLLTVMILIYITQIISSEHKQLSSIFQFNNTKQAAPEQEATTPESAEETSNQ
ncbi:MAG: hypothetical protein WGN25_19675 [Candidatus Electrothrix sp. GW3-4]|uniref:hypothetical protein n=1 Tax=Candidatus Electrothrix sp. GW3-4 TaxID=3126740 RepID=UPI0030CF72AC